MVTKKVRKSKVKTYKIKYVTKKMDGMTFTKGFLKPFKTQKSAKSFVKSYFDDVPYRVRKEKGMYEVYLSGKV